MGPRFLAPLLAALFAVVSTAGCAAPEEEVGDGADAFSFGKEPATPNTNPAAGKTTTPVVIVTVDAATTKWISAETSKVDGSVVGDAVQRQREVFFRLQTAINAGTLEPGVVQYGLSFPSAKPEAKKITEAFSKAVDASKIPVILESESGVDGTLYHSMAISDPPNMLVGEVVEFACTVEDCSSIAVPTRAGAFLKSIPQVTRAASAMARSTTVLGRDDALDAAKRGLTSDLLVLPATNPSLPKISLKDLLTNKSRAAQVKGAFLVVAPPTELTSKDGKTISTKVDDLKGSMAASFLGQY